MGDRQRAWLGTAVVVAYWTMIVTLFCGAAAAVVEPLLPADSDLRNIVGVIKLVCSVALYGVVYPAALIYIYTLSTSRGPFTEWLYLLLAAPFMLFYAPSIALSWLNGIFSFHPIPWPPDLWYKIQIDFALNGALFDFAEALDFRVTDFEPQNGKWAFAIVEIGARTMWQAWIVGVAYRLFQLLRARSRSNVD